MISGRSSDVNLWWKPSNIPPLWETEAWGQALQENMRSPVYIIVDPASQRLGLGLGGHLLARSAAPNTPGFLVRAAVPGLYPEQLGSEAFKQTHGLRFAYVGGSMALGIASPQLAIALARIGALGFYGSAGVSLNKLAATLEHLQNTLSCNGIPWGANLIHSPNSPHWEDQVVDLFLKYRVSRVEASAFMDLQPSLVRYACSGLQRDGAGHVVRQNYLFAKVSRPEVARHFMRPAPEAMVQGLVDSGQLTAQEAKCSREIPLAEDITIESDSGGHTDNRPLTALFSQLTELRTELSHACPPAARIRLGAAGGLGTPQALAAAFSLGADYVLLGSVHQATLEAGISQQAKQMLAQAEVADVSMTAAADMFEQGVKVQVLTRGTLMARRGNQLYELYKAYAAIEDIPAALRKRLEKDIFRDTLDRVWARTRSRALKRTPHEVARAERDPKHKMAMIFLSYLGPSSRWPIEGVGDRQIDYQIWCSPAMGAFNAWTRHSFLEASHNRTAGQVALNLLEGAAYVTRTQQLRLLGLPLAGHAFDYRPQPLLLA
ncbi:MAG: PfaD family polyunsaturated fatty acid/polyketide biosynthesis protein [Leptolyngbya sp. SIO1E4]|nr:PfaD family polyunsaturated fatty acid/polyketide biosynthesis protein [Leptolyngbya sp. SIO1E4]